MKKFFTLLFIAASLSAFSQVRISQVYGSGGNAGATYNQDFVELFNAGTSAVAIGGWSIQYASTAGTSWSVAAVQTTAVIGAGKYYLVGLAIGSAGAALPVTADTTGTLNLSGTGGKIVLVNVTTALTGATACGSASVIDVFGYGAASCSEGTAFSTTGSDATQSFFRKMNGCTETNNNSNDFDTLSVSPRNSASAANPCGAPTAMLNASPNITNLNTTIGVASPVQSYTLSGTTLSGFPGNITITPSANLEVSLAAGSGFTGAAITVPFTSATLAATTIYVRISASALAGTISGTVTNSGGGAPVATVNVSGNVLPAEPTVQATNVTFSAVTNSGFTVNWTNGNGSSRVVVLRQTSVTAIAPADGITYAVPGNTGTGNTVYFNGTGTGPLVITGLIAGTNYTVQVYEANGTNYFTNTATGNPNSISTTGVSPAVTQVNFTSVSTPLYGASGTATRVPVLFFATVSNLLPNTIYKYYIQAAAATDFGTTTAGAGNPLLIDYVANPVTYAYTASASLTTAGGFARFTTNASGSFTGAFGFVHTGNNRFTAGSILYPTIVLAEEAATTVQNRFALNQGITILSFSTANTATTGSYLRGNSSATPGNVVALWKSTDGNTLAAARPLSMTLAENPTISGDPWGPAATNFITGYLQVAGSWNTIIPNANANGVQLIEQLNLAGVPVGCNTDTDGTWPTGTIVTSNPVNGTTALQISATDAPINGGACATILPVLLSDFAAQKVNNNVLVKWTTTQEVNTRNFVVERSSDNRTWAAIAMVNAAGTSNTPRNYSYTDNMPVKGINYYRLKLVDNDNRYTRTGVKTVLYSAGFLITIAPNPATDFVTIYISQATLNMNHVIVTDATGKVMEKLSTKDQAIKINTNRYAKGAYYVKVVTDENVSTQKIIVE